MAAGAGRQSASLLDLHEVLQGAFGWYDCHLHEFEIDGVRYGTDDGEGWGPPPKSERRARLGTVARQGTAIRYVYDFGDDWVHGVVVEKMLQADASVTYPCCIGGKRACPPEDCGGVWGYEEFLAAVSDSDHPEHGRCWSGWVGSSTLKLSTRLASPMLGVWPFELAHQDHGLPDPEPG